MSQRPTTWTMSAAVVLLLVTSPPAALGGTPITQSPGKQAKLSKVQKEHLLDGEYRIVRRVAEIPAAVRSAFAGADFEMANPGEPFQVTDVVMEKLPWRRLVFAGCARSRCFLHYEKGGYAHGYYVVVFDLSRTDDATFYWGGALFNAASDILELRSMIGSGHVLDDKPLYW